jgi:hypothetical protein
VRNETTSGSQENIVSLSDIRNERRLASSPYGPVSQGLTTLQRTSRDLALTELLNSLESVVADLNSKSYTVYDTLNTAIEAVRVALSHTTIEEGGTE